jgi:cathepsin B
MNSLLLLGLLVNLFIATTAFNFKEELVKKINSLNGTWKAKISEKFTDSTTNQFQSLLGTFLDDKDYFQLPQHKYELNTLIPESFDVRTNWPECESIIGLVRDQSNCGSCWTFSATTAFNDRYCIASGNSKTLFSPADTLACCSGPKCGFSKGCNGGQMTGAWKWFVSTGVVTGADYGDKTTCLPYPFPSCAHHVEPIDGLTDCSTLPEFDTPKCTDECIQDYYGKYSADKVKAKMTYTLKTEQDIQQDIMKFGSVSASMKVYEDFELYNSGVYQHMTGDYLGGHGIVIIGWGVENGTLYWLARNSWNNTWALNGFFKIKRGSNECGIESGIVTGQV